MKGMNNTAPVQLDFGLRDQSIRDDGDVLVIKGVASTWDLDSDGERMAPTAFARSLDTYMSTNPIVLYSHRWSVPLGRTVDAKVLDDGLHVTVELPRPEPGTEAANVWKLVKAGVIKAFSVGGKATRAVINGVQTVTAWRLSEISVCPAGVNQNALFSMSSQVGKAFGDAPRTDPLDRAQLGLLALQLRVLDGDVQRDRLLALRDSLT